jgi:NCS1 family nucleobase:cation symporter-1
VADGERHGHPRSLFYVWFAANLSISTVITGALGVVVGNTLFWALAAIVVGNLAGALFMAAHSAQGPILGVPQLIQSRGQFGYYGAILPVILALVMYVGFWAFGVIPAAQSISQVHSGLGDTAGVLLLGIPSLVLAILGYKLIHRAQALTTYLALIGIAVLTIQVLSYGSLDLGTGGFAAGPWLLAVAIIAVYQAGFSPYVSDYSRYLPRDVGYQPPFWFTYVGTTVSAIWVMALGAMVTAQFPKLGTVEAVAAVSAGSLQWLVLYTLAIAVIGVNAMNLYGGMLSIVTGVGAFRDVGRSAVVRVVGIFVVFAAALYLAIAATDNFITNYQNFLLLLVYTFVPWTAINLTDFYVIKRGRYDIEAFFDPAGPYMNDPATRTRHGVNLNALLAYCLGVIAQVPFINTSYWKGWAVDSLDGADISWMIGLVVAAVAYFLLARDQRVDASMLNPDTPEPVL